MTHYKLPRYTIGYPCDDWGMRSSTPTGIPSPDGAWVKYTDVKSLATKNPLSDDEIAEIYTCNKTNPVRFARAIEAAHSIIKD